MCATCHVYVDDAFASRLPPMQEREDVMLDCTVSERRPNSRLACQIEVTEAMDGMTVRTPEHQ